MQNKTPELPVDPNLVPEQQRAQQDLIGSLQTQTQGDMASLMARYGTHLALAGATTSPLMTPPQSPVTTAVNRAA